MPTRYRLLRVLEYEGTLEQLTDAIDQRGVKGSYSVYAGQNDGLIIREAFVGEVPHKLQQEINNANDPS